MNATIPVYALVILLTPCAVRPALAQLEAIQIRRDSSPEPIVNNDAAGVAYWGNVTEITKTTITVQYPKEAARCFPVSIPLANGEIPMQPRPMPDRRPYDVDPSCMYRLADVKVGDMVVLLYSRTNGVLVCDHIRIQKRAGGVPPLPKEAEDLRHPVARWKYTHPGRNDVPPILLKWPTPIPYHEERNAYWDLMDKGIPYPEKFGHNRQWLTAPMPREVPATPKPKA